MFTIKHLISRIGLAFIAGTLAFNLSVAHAIPFTSDLSITGETAFDDTFSFGNTSGDFSVVSGGGTTASTYSGSSVTGANPLAGTLTDINDGFGFTGTASATNDTFGIGFDTNLNIFNNSLVDVYEIVFKLSFSNRVNATGSDAVSDSELTLGSNGGVDDLFFSDLVSDTVNGNSDDGNGTGGFGGILSASGDEFFTFLLNPSDMIDLDMSWTLEDFSGDYAGGLAEADLSAFLSVYSVTQQGGPAPVPLPATFFLVGLGLILLPLQRRMRAYMGR